LAPKVLNGFQRLGLFALTHVQRLCPRSPLGALPYNHVLAMSVHPTYFDVATPLGAGKLQPKQAAATNALQHISQHKSEVM